MLVNVDNINYTSHLHDLPSPYIVIEDGAICYMNNAYCALVGFQSPRAAEGKYYRDFKCQAAKYEPDFILRDEIVKEQQKPLHFISLYQFYGNVYHCFNAYKFLADNNPNQICTISSEVTQSINPLLCDLLSLYSDNLNKHERECFWYELPASRTRPSLLTRREIVCIRYLVRNYSNDMIAKALCISKRTVDHHFEHIRGKLGVHSKSEIIEYCVKHKLLPLDVIFSA